MEKLDGVYYVKLTALARVHESFVIRLPYPMAQEEFEYYIRDQANNRSWQYDAVREETIEIDLQKRD